MKFNPLHDRVLIKRADEEEKSAGGIIIPDSAKEKPTRAKVIAVGPGKLDDHGKIIAMQVKTGDMVLIGKYSGTDIKLDGVEHVIVREDEILGIVS